MAFLGAVTAGTTQGPRPHQEDRHVVYRFLAAGGLGGWLLAVLDGHNGSAAAEACEQAIPHLFCPRDAADAEQALRRVVAQLAERTEAMIAGSTISLACILESQGTASVAVLGDSPVVAIDRGGRLWVSPHHNVRTNIAERMEGEERGGVYDPSGYLIDPVSGYGLQMARALGDRAMGHLLSRTPDVQSLDLGPDSLVLLATDGLVDMSRQDSGRLVAELSTAWRAGSLRDAASLIEWAEHRGLWDNTTAVVWSSRKLGG